MFFDSGPRFDRKFIVLAGLWLGGVIKSTSVLESFSLRKSLDSQVLISARQDRMLGAFEDPGLSGTYSCVSSA